MSAGHGDKGRRVSPAYENGTIMVIYQTRLKEMGGPRHRLRNARSGYDLTMVHLPLAPVSDAQKSLGLKAGTP